MMAAGGPSGEAPPELSVVIAAHNEEENLPVLWAELASVLDRGGWRAEAIFVDDGSTDRTPELVREFRRSDSRVRLLRLARNTGLSAAFDAGLRRARGAVVVTMDGDLQNDPRDIPLLLEGLKGADATTGWRHLRRDPWLKRFSSRFANAFRNAVTGDSIRDSACSLRAMRRACVPHLDLSYRGLHRFVPTLLRMRGFRVVEVPVNHRPRRFGQSHFGVRNRAWRAFCDLLAVRWMLGEGGLGVTVETDPGAEPDEGPGGGDLAGVSFRPPPRSRGTGY